VVLCAAAKFLSFWITPQTPSADNQRGQIGNDRRHIVEQGLGGSSRFRFNTSLRWSSASFTSFPRGSFKNFPIVS
jgi:hypothetical protein